MRGLQKTAAWAVAGVLSLLAAAPVSKAAANEKVSAATKGVWKNLCNGHNLDGWEVVNTGGKWTVENGIIIARRTPPDRGASWLVTKKDYGDFILRLKYKSATERYNSGVLIRDPAHAKLNRPAYSGFEIIIAQGQNDENTNAAIYYVSNAYTQSLHAGEWADFEIRAIGDHIVTFMNGKKMAETHSRRSYKGGIGFHLHGGEEPAENWWKDVQIQELPPAPRPFQLDEERLEQEPGEFVPMLAAASLDGGFTHYGDPKATWSLDKDTLRATGASEGSWIVTKQPYANFVLTFDFKLDSPKGGGVGFRIPADAFGNFADRGYELTLAGDETVNPPGSIFNVTRAFVRDPNLQPVYRAGQWNRVRIYATGDHLMAYVNLTKTAEVHAKRSSQGRIGFNVNPGGVTEFRNVNIKHIESPGPQKPKAQAGNGEAHVHQ